MIQRNLLRAGSRIQRGFAAGPIPEDTHVMEKISKEDRIFVAPFNYYGRHQVPEGKKALWQYLSHKLKP